MSLVQNVPIDDFCSSIGYSLFNVVYFAATALNRIFSLIRNIKPNPSPSAYDIAIDMLIAEENENIEKYNYPDTLALKIQAEKRKDQIIQLSSQHL